MGGTGTGLGLRLIIYIFIHQNGSTQKENTNIQTKSSIKNTPD